MKNKKNWEVSPVDYLSDVKVMPMTMEQEGMYFRLMPHCWTEGFIPKSASGIAKICKGMDVDRVRFNWPALKVCFVRSEDNPDHLVQPRISKDLKKKKNLKRFLTDDEKPLGRLVFEHYLKLSGKTEGRYHYTERRREMIGLALDRGWTVEDQMEAITRLFNDQWPGRIKYSGLEYCIGLLPNRGDFCETWLNRPSGKRLIDEMELD